MWFSKCISLHKVWCTVDEIPDCSLPERFRALWFNPAVISPRGKWRPVIGWSTILLPWFLFLAHGEYLWAPDSYSNRILWHILTVTSRTKLSCYWWLWNRCERGRNSRRGSRVLTAGTGPWGKIQIKEYFWAIICHWYILCFHGEPLLSLEWCNAPTNDMPYI